MAQSAFLGKGMLNVILIVCVDNVAYRTTTYCRFYRWVFHPSITTGK
ncbi:hypothetical protein ECH7EC4113_4025, partial [Escherichia coli O157:H7 str. EC4113]